MAAELQLRSSEYLFPVNRRGKVRPCPHCQRRRHICLTLLIGGLALLLGAILAVAWEAGGPAPVTTAHGVQLDSYGGYVGARMLDRAESRAGDWYVYAATGPNVFDCSGLVYWAAGSVGEANWPRDTYDIAREIGTRFTITSHPQRGDLALWGSVSAPYHVEFVTIWSQITFGAEAPTYAGRVNWHYDGWFAPSFFLHINW